MGWSDIGDGMYDGDGPADAVGDAMRLIGEKRPSAESVLRSFVAALRLDGSLAPFYVEPMHAKTMRVHHGRRAVDIDEAGAEPWIVVELYGMLDQVAEEYVAVVQRPPHLRELVRYVSSYFDEPDLYVELFGETKPWRLEPASFTFGQRKPKDRAYPPAVRKPAGSGLRVVHPKFGVGTIVEERGDRVVVDFGGARRTLLRKFVELAK